MNKLAPGNAAIEAFDGVTGLVGLGGAVVPRQSQLQSVLLLQSLQEQLALDAQPAPLQPQLQLQFVLV